MAAAAAKAPANTPPKPAPMPTAPEPLVGVDALPLAVELAEEPDPDGVDCEG